MLEFNITTLNSRRLFLPVVINTHSEGNISLLVVPIKER